MPEMCPREFENIVRPAIVTPEKTIGIMALSIRPSLKIRALLEAFTRFPHC
jgi:hypothetical protein